MPKKLVWTDAQDNQIRRLRVEGASWDAIAAVLGITRWTVIERGRRVHLGTTRRPLPAGHPRSWGAITAGTVLENAPYPLPVFPR